MLPLRLEEFGIPENVNEEAACFKTSNQSLLWKSSVWLLSFTMGSRVTQSPVLYMIRRHRLLSPGSAFWQMTCCSGKSEHTTLPSNNSWCTSCTLATLFQKLIYIPNASAKKGSCDWGRKGCLEEMAKQLVRRTPPGNRLIAPDLFLHETQNSLLVFLM